MVYTGSQCLRAHTPSKAFPHGHLPGPPAGTQRGRNEGTFNREGQLCGEVTPFNVSPGFSASDSHLYGDDLIKTATLGLIFREGKTKDN